MMIEKNDKTLTALQILTEIEGTSSAKLTTSYVEFERFVEQSKFTCMEFALDRLFQTELISGHISDICDCCSCSKEAHIEVYQQATVLLSKIKKFNGVIVSDNIRMIAQLEFDAQKMAKHFGTKYTGVDFTTLADLVACEMDISGPNFPFFYDDVATIVTEKIDEAILLETL